VAILDDPIICKNTGSLNTTTYFDDGAYRLEQSDFRFTSASGFFGDDIFLVSGWRTQEKLTSGPNSEIFPGKKIYDYFVNWGFPITHVGCSYFWTVNGGWENTYVPQTLCDWEFRETTRAGGASQWFTEVEYFRENKRTIFKEKSEARYEYDIPGPNLTPKVATRIEPQVTIIEKESSIVIQSGEYSTDVIPKAGLTLTAAELSQTQVNSSNTETSDGTLVIGCFSESYLAYPTLAYGLITYRLYLETNLVLTIPNVASCEFHQLAHNSDLSSIFILEIYTDWDLPPSYRFFGIYEGVCTELTDLVGSSLNVAGGGWNECEISGLLPLRARN
jgi:hypothetical protein